VVELILMTFTDLLLSLTVTKIDQLLAFSLTRSHAFEREGRSQKSSVVRFFD